MAKSYALATISMHQMAGGLEKNIVYLANELTRQGHSVKLLTFDLPDSESFYEMDEKVTWHCLGRTKPHQPISFKDRIKLLFRMRKALTEGPKTNTLICFHHGIILRFLVASLFTDIQLIGSERNSLTIYKYLKLKKWNLNFFMLFLVNKITVQFPSYIDDYPAIMKRKIHVVHNPVYPVALADDVERQKEILSIGRLSAQKRFDLLIKSFGIVHKNHPDWSLKIIGNGPLKSELEELIEAEKLTDHVKILEPVSDLKNHFATARLYCQPSQWEGFPNAQAEAMSAGLIPIGFASTRGVSDLIEDQVNGVLCHGAIKHEPFAETILTVIKEEKRWLGLSKEAEKIAHTYSHVSWWSCWQNVLGS